MSHDYPEDYQTTLIHMLTAPTLEDATVLAVRALRLLVDTPAAGLLLWDADLDRYVIGEVLVTPPEEAPQARRHLLRSALAAYRHNTAAARCLDDGLYYEPLNTPSGAHVGAFLYSISAPAPILRTGHTEYYPQLVRATTRAIWTMTRIEQADREHTQLVEDRERLQQLLHAVDQQQQTIDRLLTLERQFSASLEAQVEERTTALRDAQARIIHSEKLAVIGKLAASLAHEINNPLQAIQSGLGLMLAELASGQVANVHADLRVIQAELERVQSIFKQMLDFNRPAPAQREPLDLNAICEGVRVLLRKRLQETNIDLRLELAPHLPLTCGDSNQIKQVLINLVLNSAEAISPTGGHIEIGTRRSDHQVRVQVTDTGCGISPEHQSQLFEPFFTTKTRGLGLGLAISQEIVEKHRGRITVRSAIDQGTTFTIILPVEEHCHDR